MHPLCQELKDCIPQLMRDDFPFAGLLSGVEEILATEQTNVVATEVMSRILDTVLPHPMISHRFRRFISDEATRRGPRIRFELPSLQELFETLRLVKNRIIEAHPVTDDDVAAECIANPNPAAKPFAEGGVDGDPRSTK